MNAKKSGFIITELTLIVSGLISLFIFNLSGAQKASQDAANLRNLLVLRDAMSEHYAHYNERATLSNLEKSSEVRIGSGQKINIVTLNSGFTFTKLNSNKCTKNSQNKEIVFYETVDGLMYCKTNGGTELMMY